MLNYHRTASCYASDNAGAWRGKLPLDPRYAAITLPLPSTKYLRSFHLTALHYQGHWNEPFHCPRPSGILTLTPSLPQTSRYTSINPFTALYHQGLFKSTPLLPQSTRNVDINPFTPLFGCYLLNLKLIYQEANSNVATIMAALPVVTSTNKGRQKKKKRRKMLIFL